MKLPKTRMNVNIDIISQGRSPKCSSWVRLWSYASFHACSKYNISEKPSCSNFLRHLHTKWNQFFFQSLFAGEYLCVYVYWVMAPDTAIQTWYHSMDARYESRWRPLGILTDLGKPKEIWVGICIFSRMLRSMKKKWPYYSRSSAWQCIWA